LLFDEKYEVVP